MTELFESTIDNVSELEVRGYSDPVKMERTMEILAKTGDEEYLYKFKGPGVRMANPLNPMVDDCLKLSKEINKLIFEKVMMKKENDKLKKEAADCLRLRDERKEESMRLKEENKHLREDIVRAKNELHSLKQENLSLMEQNQALSEGNKDLRAEFDKVIKRAEELRKMINESKGLHYPITRERVLEQAKECVCGQREQDYGTPESNFQLIADLWNGYLGFMDHPQDQIRATDVAMMMALMKIARIRNGGGSGDSFVDLAGYAACGGEIWHGERHSNA